jgi:hypothetical protein
MYFRCLLALLLISLSLSARAEPTNFSIEEAMNQPSVQKALKPGLKVLWGSRKVEDEVVERAETGTYTRTHFGGSVRESGKKQDCMDIFADAMEDMIATALLRDYDVIAEVRGTYKGKGPQDENMFICDVGFRSSDIVLSGTFVQTRAGAADLEKIRNAPERQAAIRNRPLSPNTLLLPLGSILESPEARAILGSMVVHWGNSGAPQFSERFGPDTYEDDASIRKLGREGACKQAVLNALHSMVEDVKEHKYDGLVMVRSYYDDQWAPDDKSVECNVAGSSAEIKLVGTLIKLKSPA